MVMVYRSKYYLALMGTLDRKVLNLPAFWLRLHLQMFSLHLRLLVDSHFGRIEGVGRVDRIARLQDLVGQSLARSLFPLQVHRLRASLETLR